MQRLSNIYLKAKHRVSLFHVPKQYIGASVLFYFVSEWWPYGISIVAIGHFIAGAAVFVSKDGVEWCCTIDATYAI